MKIIKGKKGKNMPPERERELFAQQRRGLLAKIHIAKKELGLSDELYREILVERYCVDTAASLSISEMEDLVAYFKECGWNEKRYERSRIKALQIRVLSYREALGARRVAGVCEKILGVSDPRWCQDLNKLRRACAVLQKIYDTEVRK